MAELRAFISEHEGTYNVTVFAEGEGAKQASEALLHTLADNKLAYIRTEPWEETEVDYDTKQKRTVGGTRFAFKNEPGKWHPVQTLMSTFIGELA